MLSGDAARPGEMLSTVEKRVGGIRTGIIRCRPKNSEAMAPSSGAHEGLMCPLEKGVRGIEIGHQMPGRSWRAGQAQWRWKARRP